MSELYSNFQGYLQLNIPRIKWVLGFGFLFSAIYYFLQIKGYTKRGRNMVASMIFGIMLSFNCSFIFVMTLFGRRMGEIHRFELKPLESYFVAFVEGEVEILLQILVNIAMYIPIGLLLPCCFKLFEKYRYIFLMAFISSLCIELTQVVFKIGLFEVDDIINNTMGCIVGAGIRILISKYQKVCNKESIT